MTISMEIEYWVYQLLLNAHYEKYRQNNKLPRLENIQGRIQGVDQGD